MPALVSPMLDQRAVVDAAEISARWALAYLGIPEQPECFWASFSASTEEALRQEAPLWANACAVMADFTQPIGMES